MMKKNIQILCLAVGSWFFHNPLVAQSIGVGVNYGYYSPSFTNSLGVEEEVTGGGILGISAFTELPILETENSKFPVGLTYNRFSTEHNLNSSLKVTQMAQTLTLDLGYKYFFAREDKKFRPFAQLSFAYEAYVNSTYYYDEFQNGRLDWGSNLYSNVFAGVSVDTEHAFRLEIFGKVGLGLLNRLSGDAKYTDQVFSIGTNVIFK